MFEKEAEDSFNCKKVLYKWENDKHSYINGFKDEAEFCYNKAFVEADKNLKAIVTDFNKAKEIIRNLIDSLEVIDGEQTRELKVVKEAEQFLINLERYENDK